MKIALKLSAYFILGLVLLLLLGVLGLSSNSVQRRLASVFLEKRFDYVGLGSVYLKPSSFELRNVHLVKGSTTLGLESLVLDWEFLSLFTPKKIKVRSIELTGAYCDLAPEEGLKEPSVTSNPISSIGDAPLPKVEKYDMHLVLGGCKFLNYLQIDTIRLLGSIKQGSQTVEVEVTSPGLAPTQGGSLFLKANFTDEKTDTILAQASLDGILNIQPDASLQSPKLDFTAKLKGQSPWLSAPLQLKIDALIEPNLLGERYLLEWFLLDNENAIPLAQIDGVWDSSNQGLSSTFTLNTTEDQLLEFYKGLQLPDLNIKLHGSLQYGLATKIFALAAFLDIDASSLERLDQSLQPFEALYVRTALDLQGSPDKLELKVLNTTLQDKKGNNLVKCTLSQPFIAKMYDNTIHFSKANGELILLELKDFPLNYFANYIADYNWSVSPVFATFALHLDDNQKISIQATRPLKLENVKLWHKGQPLVQDINIEILPLFSYEKNNISIDYPLCRVTHVPSSQDLFSMHGLIKLSLDEKGISAWESDGKILANINGLSTQNIFIQNYNPKLTAPIRLASAYSLAYDGLKNIFKLKTLECVISKDFDLPKSQAYLALDCLQATLFDVSGGIFDPFSASALGPLFKVDCNELPISLLSPLCKGFTLSGESISTALVISRADLKNASANNCSGYSFVLDNPLLIKGVSVYDEKTSWINNLNVNAPLEGFASADYIQLKWNNATFSTASKQKPILASSGHMALIPSLGAEGLEQLDCNASIDLAQALSLPVTPGISNLKKGKLQLVAYANPKEDGSFKIVLNASNLSLVAPAKDIESIYLSLSGEYKTLEDIRAKGPFLIQGPSGSSKLDIDLNYTPVYKDQLYKAVLKGENLFLEDLLLLGQVLTPENTLPPRYASIDPKALNKGPPLSLWEAPFWSKAYGKLGITLDNLYYKDLLVTDLKAQSMMTPSICAIQLSTKLSGAPSNTSFEVTFTPKAELPYALKTSLSISNLNIATALTGAKLIPTSPIEGVFAIQGKGHSQGLALDDLLSNIKGELSLDGKNGAIKTFAATSKSTQNTAKALAIAGSLLGSQVKELDFGAQVIQFFSNIPYDTCTILVKRELSKDIDICAFSLQGPEVHLHGKGKINHALGIPVQDQSMQIDAKIDAKGKGAALLNSLNLMKNSLTPEAYYSGPSFVIKGSIAKPDFSQLYSLLTVPKINPSSSSSSSSSPPPAKPAQPPAEQKPSLKNIFKFFE